jgi:hypothetical protein
MINGLKIANYYLNKALEKTKGVSEKIKKGSSLTANWRLPAATWNYTPPKYLKFFSSRFMSVIGE